MKLTHLLCLPVAATRLACSSVVGQTTPVETTIYDYDIISLASVSTRTRKPSMPPGIACRDYGRNSEAPPITRLRTAA